MSHQLAERSGEAPPQSWASLKGFEALDIPRPPQAVYSHASELEDPE